jgi:hypothetical protein
VLLIKERESITTNLSTQFDKKIEAVFNDFGQPQDEPQQQYHPLFQMSEQMVQVELQSQSLCDNIIPCKLYIQMVNGGLEVADIQIYLGASTIHCEPLPINHLRVSIDKVFDGCHEILVPYPTKEEKCLAELIMTYLIWPEELVDPIIRVNLINMM